MRAGSLRHRVLIESRQTSVGDLGGSIITWPELDTVWANVEPLRGQEYLAGQQLSNKVVAKITIRYRGDVTTDMRATWGTTVYDITDVVNVKGRYERLELMCQEVS